MAGGDGGGPEHPGLQPQAASSDVFPALKTCQVRRKSHLQGTSLEKQGQNDGSHPLEL